MAKVDRFDQILNEYRAKYDVDSLSSPNDVANLHAFIKIQIAVEKLQAEIERLMDEDMVGNIDSVQKLGVAQEKMLEKGLQLERALALDRKSRQSDKADNFADYLAGVKIMGKEFLEKQFILIRCDDCNILVGRVIPALEHTAFSATFTCSQCNKKIKAERKERDIFYDFGVKDKDWRRKHKYEVIQGKSSDAPILDDSAQLIIEDDTADTIFEGDINGTTEETR